MPSSARSNLNSATCCDDSADPGPSADLSHAGPSARLLLAALRGYQVLLSPLFAGSCRYVPSCSQYMAEAVRRHGALRGSWLGLRRLGRCHPLGSSGFDPVPDNNSGSRFPGGVPGAHAPRECRR